MNLSLNDLKKYYQLPFNALLKQAHTVYDAHHDVNKVHLCGSFSIKTGNCPEDCAYCPQSGHYQTNINKVKLVSINEVLEVALRAQTLGVTHFCLGGAWRALPDNHTFQKVLAIVKRIKQTGLEVCCSLGSISTMQAHALFEAGCTIYNYNLDTSQAFYPNIITTRTFISRYETLQMIQQSPLKISCGGILGMGESIADRLDFIYLLSQLSPQPDMVPLNALVAIEGTPLAHHEFIDAFEYVRMIAIARIAMPNAIIAMAAGRYKMSAETQALAFFCGANAIYIGERILVTKTPDLKKDFHMLKKLGVTFNENPFNFRQ